MKPVAGGSVVVRLPIVDVEEEFARTLGADETGSVERIGDGEYRATSRAGLSTVVQRFTLVAMGDEATAVDALIYVRPAFLGWVARRLGRRRIEAGVQAALERMARAATGEPEPEPEFGPEDFADDAGDDAAEDGPGGDFRKGTPAG